MMRAARMTLTRSVRPLMGVRRFSSSNEKVIEEAEVISEKAESGLHEQVKGATETKSFQAETLKLLNIVTHSLYSKKEVFLRELVSNASDALEKARQIGVAGHAQWSEPLEISLVGDEDKKRLVMQDTGVGMSKDELVDNLGTIAHSGTQDFITKLGDAGSADASAIIGQFGVGFYSVFMVADRVTVYSRQRDSDTGYMWSSDGSGAYELGEADNVAVGTKIIIDLKDDCKEFARAERIQSLIQAHSNFVSFPITVNGSRVNTVEAIWTHPTGSVSADQHKEFYQFLSGQGDSPSMTLMYQIDTPINLRSVLYVPSSNREQFGMQSNDTSNMSLYSRRVLIQGKTAQLLPEWLRFVVGVVDSEDVPLSVSREHLQDQRIIMKINAVLTKRLIKEFKAQLKKDPIKYDKFFNDFGIFLKQGACVDDRYRTDLASLLRMDSTGVKYGQRTTLDDYVGRMHEKQKDIYYLHVPSRALGESSPYYEAFKAKGLEVIMVYNVTDEVVMQHVANYDGKRIVSIESSTIDLSDFDNEKKDPDAPEEKPEEKKKQEEEASALCKWMKDEVLKERVTDVTPTDRLYDTPVLISDFEGASMRKMMRMMSNETGGVDMQIPPQKLQVNPKHPLLLSIATNRTSNPELARLAVEQLFDNALLTAGLMDDSRVMLPRINTILESMLSKKN